MSCLAEIPALLCFGFVLLSFASTADIKTECVACVYNYAANGTTDYSCVSDPFSHALSRNVTCNFTSQSCIITILYDTPDSEHIRSMERKCDFTKNQSTECDPYTPSTCLSECRTNFCNTYSVVTRNFTSFSTSTKSTASTQYTPPPTTGKGDTQNSTSSTESTSSTAASTESTSLTTAKDGNTQNYTSPTESTSSTKSATSQESTSPTTAKADIKTECVSCVYNYAANGTTDYSCVSDPFSHALSRNDTCNFTSQSCIIKILYDTPDSELIRSMERKCDFTKNQSKECDPYTPSTCLSECRTNFCNTYSVVTRNLTSFSTSTKSTASTQYTPPPTTGKADIKPKCVACTYNYAGDGTVDYSCVSDPFSQVTSRNLTCDFTSNSCIIRVVYTSPDFKQIQSLVRGCEPTKNQKDKCDAYDPPTCLLECRSNFCNSIFGDIQNPPVTNGGIRLAFFGLLFVCLGLQHGL